MASALCRPGFLRTQTMRPFKMYPDIRVPALPSDVSQRAFAQLPGPRPNPGSMAEARMEAQNGVPASEITWPSGALMLTPRIAPKVTQAAKDSDKAERAYEDALRMYREEGAARAREVRRELRTLDEAGKMPGREAQRAAARAALLERLASAEAQETAGSLPGSWLEQLNTQRAGYDLEPLTAVPGAATKASTPRTMDMVSMLLGAGVSDATVRDAMKPSTRLTESEEEIKGRTDAAARRARCAELLSAIPQEDRLDRAKMEAFCAANAECCDAQTLLATCNRTSIPARFDTQAEKNRFLLANPSCVRWAVEVPVGSDSGPPAPEQEEEVVEEEEEDTVVPPCSVPVPARFATDAEKAAFNTANPGCAPMSAEIPVGTDYTKYYIAAGVVAGVAVLGTAAYFVLRNKGEDEQDKDELPAPASASEYSLKSYRSRRGW